MILKTNGKYFPVVYQLMVFVGKPLDAVWGAKFEFLIHKKFRPSFLSYIQNGFCRNHGFFS